MKNQRILTTLLILILASLACGTQTPAQKTLPTRAAVIQTAAPMYLTPENWNTVPQGCVNSLVQIQSGEDEFRRMASGSLIHSSFGINQSGESGFMYTFITANHFVLDTKMKMSSKVTISVNKIGELAQSVNFTTTNIQQVTDDKGLPVDIVLISIFGPNQAITIEGNGPEPIGVGNIISGTDVTVDQVNFYHALGFPIDAIGPQFVIVTVVDVSSDFYTNYPYQTITAQSYNDSFSTTTKGDSGGPLCNNDGKIVAIDTATIGQYNQTLFVPLPNNIQNQVSNFIKKSDDTLHMLGFTKAP